MSLASELKDIIKNSSNPADFGRRMSQFITDNPDVDSDDLEGAYQKAEKKNQSKRTDSGGKTQLTKVVDGIADLANASVSDQMLSGNGQEFKGINDVINLLKDKDGNMTLNPKDILANAFDFGMNETILQLQQHHSLLRDINQETSLTGQLSRDFRDEIMDATPELVRMGISYADISTAMTTMIKDAGRFKIISEETIGKLGKTSTLFFDNIEEGAKSISIFQKVSMGAADAMDVIKDVGLESLTLGLNAKETVKELTENISKLNTYGFKDGEKGLARMIRQSQEFKIDMQDAFSIAEEVMDPSKALELAANLQVIGGGIGAFNDPIKMMYMATNDVEGLQEALLETYESLVSFDNESGTFKIMGADLRRARALSKELNIDLSKVTDTAIQAAQRTSAATDLMSSGLQISEDEREFLTNIAQMNKEKGGMVIEIPKNLRKFFEDGQVDIELSKLTQSQAEQFVKYQDEFKKLAEDPDQIIRKQVGLVENITRDVSFLAALGRREGGKAVQDIVEMAGYDPDILQMFSKDISNMLGDGMVKGINTVEEVAKNKVAEHQQNQQTNSQQNQQTNSQQNQTQTVNVNKTVQFSSKVPIDKIANMIMTDMAVKDKKSFLSAFADY